jgi:molecular chaperone DnaK (HSP70)
LLPCGGYRLLYFEELFQDLFRSTLDPVETAHGINVVGGSTRIPCIVKLVSNFFTARNINPVRLLPMAQLSKPRFFR